MTVPARLLERKRAGGKLAAAEIEEVVAGASGASPAWGDAELAAFLMAAALRGLDREETGALTRAMLDSGARWDLASELPILTDKHSTGGVGDKVSLLLGPLLAACGVPVVMLTGRSLGHTGGTADKLESIPGLRLELDRPRCLDLLRSVGLAIGVATAEIAPADRRLYALRHRTGTIDSLPLITASILSKKLATGAAAIVFDVKVGNGAFLPATDQARELARSLVDTTRALGRAASAWLTDMSQPLGRWSGHAAEIGETLGALAGEGPDDLIEVSFALALEAARLVGVELDRSGLERAVASGAARQRFLDWCAAQGAERSWLARPLCPVAATELVVEAPRTGTLAAVDTRGLGELLAEASGAAHGAGGGIDVAVALRCEARLGDPVTGGQPLARLYVRRPDERLRGRLASCFTVAESAAAVPPLLFERIS